MRQLRKLTGLKARPKAPVLGQSLDEILKRHSGLCRQLRQLLPEHLDVRGADVCEVGPGDCLATAALLIGMGAQHVDLVEIQPPVVNRKQLTVLQRLQTGGLNLDLGILRAGSDVVLNSDRVSYHTSFMDDFLADRKFSLIYSFCVLEHVENLETFFASCFRATRPGGYNLHMIDLGGHGEWEDPVPPLEFQTIPDWIYDLMYPEFHRATRRFMSDYLRSVEASGLSITRSHHLRVADVSYVESIRPRLRTAANSISTEELSVIEFAVEARREK